MILEMSYFLGHHACPFSAPSERMWTCIAPIVSITRPLNAQMWITQSCLQIHHILPFREPKPRVILVQKTSSTKPRCFVQHAQFT